MYNNGTFKSYFGAIAVPILDKGDGTISTVTHDWANATAGLSGGLAITIMRLQIRNRRVDIAKERLAELAIQNNAQFVLFIDDDVIPPHDGLMKMIKLWRSDPKYKIISGVYFAKSDIPAPLIFKGNLEGSFFDWKTTDLIEADGAGAGFLFVDTSVFKNMSKPWFSCNYMFEDPRSRLDLQKWELSDRLGQEIMKGSEADTKLIGELEKQLKEVGEQIRLTQGGQMDPNLMHGFKMDNATTEDLYFFKKAKEELGEKLWIDCSIQCWHQDKRTGKLWGLQPDMPQSRPRYEGRYDQGDEIVVDIGAGGSNYFIKEGKPITIDNDPAMKPDILCDARQIPLADTFADMVFSSHTLEHFSFRESVNVLKEWIRILKIDGKLVIIVPNLKWASEKVLNEETTQGYDAERALFMYYSAQKGDLREAHTDFHKAGFTAQSLKGLLQRIPELTDIQVFTTDGNIGNWEEQLLPHDRGYNIIAIAKKLKHDAPISLKAPLKMQEEAKFHIGDKAKQIVLKANPLEILKKKIKEVESAADEIQTADKAVKKKTKKDERKV